MLVLSRKRDEAIVIGGDIKITVVKMKGSAVLLGIEAPQSVTIFRGELGIAAPAEMPVHREEVTERIDGGPPALEFATCA